MSHIFRKTFLGFIFFIPLFLFSQESGLEKEKEFHKHTIGSSIFSDLIKNYNLRYDYRLSARHSLGINGKILNSGLYWSPGVFLHRVQGGGFSVEVNYKYYFNTPGISPRIDFFISPQLNFLKRSYQKVSLIYNLTSQLSKVVSEARSEASIAVIFGTQIQIKHFYVGFYIGPGVGYRHISHETKSFWPSTPTNPDELSWIENTKFNKRIYTARSGLNFGFAF